MPKEAKKTTPNIVNRRSSSSLASFVERPVPTDKEVASFEKVIKQEARHQEIDANLSEIYRDTKGRLVDVKKMSIRSRQSVISRWFKKLFFLITLGVVAYFAYDYFFSNQNNIGAVEFTIVAPEKIMAGEEFSYLINYHNPTKFALSQINLEIKYPDSFIFSGSSVSPQRGNYGWDLPELAAGGSASLSITGKIINKSDSVNLVSGRLSYVPVNFSSQFKKEASASTLLGNPGFQVDLDFSQTAFLNQENEFTIIFSNITGNSLGDFYLNFVAPDGAEIWVASTTPALPASESSKKITVLKEGSASWLVSGLELTSDRQMIVSKYLIKQSTAGQAITVRLEKKIADGQAYVFWEKTITPELIDSDLNLTLYLNDSKNDTPVNFAQPLDYRLSYNNQGSHTFKDVAIMASLKGDFLDWSAWKNEQSAEVHSNGTVIWTKEEIPALAEIQPGQSGEIVFSLKLKPFSSNNLGQEAQIVSYAQYSVNNQATPVDQNKSNTITSRINSDLSLVEQIRYFNDDNIPVGSGPLPPKVGEATSFKVYWTVKNNLHELNETRVVFSLPSYVTWNDQVSTNVGSLYYDNSSHQVIWEIGRLPVSVYRADAEFGISLAPAESDRNKILVLSPGALITATDTETLAVITKRTDAKTTKLEDDDIASLNNSGRIE